jgi:hypothetical protein
MATDDNNFNIFNNPFIERFAKRVLKQSTITIYIWTQTENNPGIGFCSCEEKVLEYFNELIEWEFSTENEEQDEEKNEESEKLEILAAYFVDTYIGRIVRNNQRKNTLFPVKIWNCCEMIENNLPT